MNKYIYLITSFFIFLFDFLLCCIFMLIFYPIIYSSFPNRFILFSYPSHQMSLHQSISLDQQNFTRKESLISELPFSVSSRKRDLLKNHEVQIKNYSLYFCFKDHQVFNIYSTWHFRLFSLNSSLSIYLYSSCNYFFKSLSGLFFG